MGNKIATVLGIFDDVTGRLKGFAKDVVGSPSVVTTDEVVASAVENAAPSVLTRLQAALFQGASIGTTSTSIVAALQNPAAPGDLPAIQSLVSGYVDAVSFGVKNDGTPTQVAMDALMASNYKVIRFRPGIYNATLANGKSGRTFQFDEGAIIDGTIHLAVGSGPDIGGGVISLVKDTYVVGPLWSSVRLGMYYCDGVHVDHFRLADVNSAIYAGQASYGGSNGVHIYCGSRNIYLPEILIDSASAGAYAIGIDISTTDDDQHWPTNVDIGKATIRGNTQAGINTVKTNGLKIADLDIQSMGAYNGANFSGDRNLRVDRVRIKGTGAAAAKDGLYVTNQNSRASFGRVDVQSTTQIGVRTLGSTPIDFEHISASGNGSDQVRLQTPGRIGQIEASGGTAGYGVNVTTGSAGISIGRVDAHGHAGTNLFVEANDVGIDNILTYGTPTGNGTFINGAQRFRNRHIETHGNSQGLRVIGAGVMMGVIHAHDNAFGIVGSGITQWSHDELIFANNTNYDSNIAYSAQPGYTSKIKTGVAWPGDADITPVHGTTGRTILYGVPLTANRTVTLSTTGAVSGDTKYRITRDGGATGAFTLTVLYKALAVGQWIDVEFYSGQWRITGFGTI